MPGGRGLRRIAALVPLALLAACGRIVPSAQPPVPPPAPPPAAQPQPAVPPIATALEAGVAAGPAIASLPLDAAQAGLALSSFRESCPRLTSRPDASGLTRAEDWRGACAAAAGWPATDAPRFFQTWFEAVRIGPGSAFATGYYEPEIAGSRTRQFGFDVPVYRRPPDLIDVELGQFSDSLKGKKIRGRVDGTQLVPYFDRSQIEGGALGGKGLEIAWAADPIEFFFLQIQGSGRLRLPDGGVMRIGYESQNGRGYTGIGRLMKDRGLITDGSMQGIVKYLRENPEEGKKIMNENKSFVFFRELTGAGPLGAMGYPVVGEASVAVDPKYVPLGAPVWLSLDRAEPNGIWVAQDTGGAIKGANRFDSFWGAGDRARAIAGGMSARGSALLFLPKAAVARLIPTVE